MYRIFAAVSGFLSVALGAFGAHGLKTMVDEKTLHAFQTGVHYQFLHTLVLLFVSQSLPINIRTLRSMQFFVAGIFCFSGSLYAITIFKILNLSTKYLGPITPIGGAFFLIAWAYLIYEFIKTKE